MHGRESTVIAIDGDGASGMHRSDLELYRFITPFVPKQRQFTLERVFAWSPNFKLHPNAFCSCPPTPNRIQSRFAAAPQRPIAFNRDLELTPNVELRSTAFCG
jgi:hypothetical protein